MQNLASQENWKNGWVFDGRKNLYAPEQFLPTHESTFEVGPPKANVSMLVPPAWAEGKTVICCNSRCVHPWV
jgi:hypothetical protein